MMKGVLVVLLCCVAFASAVRTEAEYQSEFIGFLTKFDKSYDVDEMFHRFNIFKRNVDLIDNHNALAAAGKYTFTLAINKLADQTNDEYKKITRLET